MSVILFSQPSFQQKFLTKNSHYWHKTYSSHLHPLVFQSHIEGKSSRAPRHQKEFPPREIRPVFQVFSRNSDAGAYFMAFLAPAPFIDAFPVYTPIPAMLPHMYKVISTPAVSIALREVGKGKEWRRKKHVLEKKRRVFR